MSTFSDQINELSASGRRYYSDLTFKERKQLVVNLIKSQSYIELISSRDADDLPHLIANIIESNGSPESLKSLSNKLMQIYVTGSPEKEAYFADVIDEALEQTAEAKANAIAYLCDLRAQIEKERARDMQQEFKRYY